MLRRNDGVMARADTGVARATTRSRARDDGVVARLAAPGLAAARCRITRRS
jgi:hypothetical protein